MRAGWTIFALAAAMLLLLPSRFVAAQATQPAQPTQAAQPAGEIRRSTSASAAPNTTGPSAARVALSLGTVLALIVVLALAARRFLPRGAFGQHGGGVGGGGAAVQVLARTAIAPKQRVLLLQVGRRILVVADAGQSLTTLTEITDADEAAALVAQLQSEKAGGSFTAVLNGAMERFRAAQHERRPTATPNADAQPNLDAVREEIEGLAKRVRGMAR